MSIESLSAPIAATSESEIANGILSDSPRTPEIATRESSTAATRFVPTVEHLLYGIALIVALGVRVYALGALLYTPLEAANSWQAWLDAMALQVVNAPQPTSALLHGLQTALFWLFDGGANDATGNLLGRLPIALAGALIVLLPWYWRNVLGRWTALALAVLLAIDPWLLTLGRLADGAVLSAAAALTTITALHVAAENARLGKNNAWASATASIALGLLLASGVQAWPWLLVVASYALLVEPAGTRALVTARNLILLGVALALGATTLLAQPESLRLVSASLGAWLQRFGGSEYGLAWVTIRLLVDSPLLMIAAIAGVVQAWRLPTDHAPLRLWLTVWLLLALALLVAPGRSPLDFALLAPPLAVFAAIAIGAVVNALLRNYDAEEWQDAKLLGVVLGMLVVGVLFWGTSAIWSREWSNLDWFVTAGFVALFLVLVAIFGFLISGRQGLLVAAIVVCGALLALSLSSAYKLASPARPAFPNGFFAEAIYPDLRHLPADVRTLSDRRKGDDRELPVLVINDTTRTPDPLLGWTLRSMRNLRFVDSWQMVATYADQTPPLVITPGEDVAVSQWNQYYLGSPYRTTFAWLPDSLPPLLDRPEGSNFWAQSGRPWLRWLLLREATPATPAQVNLWATAQ